MAHEFGMSTENDPQSYVPSTTSSSSYTWRLLSCSFLGSISYSFVRKQVIYPNRNYIGVSRYRDTSQPGLLLRASFRRDQPFSLQKAYRPRGGRACSSPKHNSGQAKRGLGYSGARLALLLAIRQKNLAPSRKSDEFQTFHHPRTYRSFRRKCRRPNLHTPTASFAVSGTVLPAPATTTLGIPTSQHLALS